MRAMATPNFINCLVVGTCPSLVLVSLSSAAGVIVKAVLTITCDSLGP